MTATEGPSRGAEHMDEQLEIFHAAPERDVQLPMQLGHAEVTAVEPPSILTRATGFMADYDYTLNPYSGCSFGCTYCYAAFFSRKVELQHTWGQWVQAKVNAVDTLRR